MKYKLIKVYPGSEPVGTIYEVNDNILVSKNYRVNKKILTQFPEFFQKVKLLGKTEDEFDVYEGDTLYYIYKNLNYRYINVTKCMKEILYKDYIWFRELDNCVKYLLDNHKFISLNNLRNGYKIDERINELFLILKKENPSVLKNYDESFLRQR